MPNLIEDDEHIIIFDCIERPISKAGYAALSSSGVKTALINVEWIFVEPSAGVYDWSGPDDFVDKCVSNGLKALLITPDAAPVWFSNDWYCQSKSGEAQRYYPYYSTLSPWNAEAQAYQDEFTRKVIDRYSSYKVQAIRGGPHGGESLLPYSPCYFDPCAKASFREWANRKYNGNISAFSTAEKVGVSSWDQVTPGDFIFSDTTHHPVTKEWIWESMVEMVVRQQSLLVNHYGGEAWMMLAHCWHDSYQVGNFVINDIVDILKHRVTTQVNWIAFAHYNMDSTLQGLALERVKECSLWVGSQYCEGLEENTPKAIASGVRGFVTGPLSVEDGHNKTEIEPWMIDKLKWSLSEWRKA